MSENKTGLTYADAGVDTAEGARAVDAIRESVQSTYRAEVIGDIGGFGGLFSIAAAKEMQDPVLVSGTDGVGTKIELARQLDIYDTVGIDLVAMCVNDVLVTVAEPLFFLDYIAVGKIEKERMAQLVEGVAEGCRQAGCALVGGEMAEHPGVMADDALDMSGFCTALVDRPNMIDCADIKEGDLIFGLPSNGFHSNGFSLIRRVVEGLDLNTSLKDCESFEGEAMRTAEVAAEVAEATEAATRAEVAEQTLGEALLTPTRIYVKLILDLLSSGVALKGMAHITGGGITENLDRILPVGTDALVKLGSWTTPSVIKYICTLADLSEKEALRTFNCGIGFALVVSPEDAPALRDALDVRGETYFEIGSIEKGEGNVRYC